MRDLTIEDHGRKIDGLIHADHFTGVIYYCPIKERFYILQNVRSGSTPINFKEIKDNPYTGSWSVSKGSVSDLVSNSVIIVDYGKICHFKDDKKEEKIIITSLDSTHHLKEAHVTIHENLTRVLIYKEGNEYYLLHNNGNYNGANPNKLPSELKEEYKYSWNIGRGIIRDINNAGVEILEILSSYSKKITPLIDLTKHHNEVFIFELSDSVGVVFVENTEIYFLTNTYSLSMVNTILPGLRRFITSDNKDSLISLFTNGNYKYCYKMPSVYYKHFKKMSSSKFTDYATEWEMSKAHHLYRDIKTSEPIWAKIPPSPSILYEFDHFPTIETKDKETGLVNSNKRTKHVKKSSVISMQL